MKSTKQLQALFDNAKGDNQFYSFKLFKHDAQQFIKDIKKYKTICHISASKSGMSRTFNYDKYNMLLNICYNKKISWEPVKVGGCGMDMHWYLQFRTCEDLCTKAEIEKYGLNGACSSGKTI